MPAPRKSLSKNEREFARLIGAEEYTPVQAARVLFKWRCEPGSREAQKARDLARAKRVKEAIRNFHLQKTKELEAERIVDGTGDVDLDRLVPFLRKRLEEFRDADIEAQTRLNAIDALDRLADPSADVNLVMRWVDLVWRFAEAHCPCCHADFPLHRVENPSLVEYREQAGIPEPENLPTTDLDRRLTLLDKASPLDKPHVSQRAALGAPERHLVGLGAARCLAEDEKIPLMGGEWARVRDLVGRVFTLPAFGVLGKLTPAKAWATDNGLRPVYRVRTVAGGREIVRTAEHPLLSTRCETGHGRRAQPGRVSWTPVGELREGDLVAVPTRLSLSGNTAADPRWVKILGYLLGDGGTTQHVNFTQVEGKVKDEFRSLVAELGCVCVEKTSLTLSVRGNVLRQNPILEKIREWGINSRSKDKQFPSWVWSLPDNQLALLVNRLFACDGYALARGEIAITLASERMIRDVEMACLRLGVSGRVRSRAVTYRGAGRSFKAWEFAITRADQVIRFAEVVGIFGKEEAVARAEASARKKDWQRNRWEYSGLPDGYMWQKVASVEPLGLLPTVNVEVDSYHTFLTTFVEHNSGKSQLLAFFGILALMIPGSESWLVSKTYREAEKEKDFILAHFQALFHPYDRHVVKIYESATDGTLKMFTKWGSILEIRSATARASITGHELDLAMVAEPGWVAADTYEELRARMSSRLGRIMALGTPKGETGFIARMVRTMGRDEEGKIIRRRPEDRLIENGCPWNVSMMVFTLLPEHNPAFVKSELGAARQELTDEEYASEFRGQMTSIEGAAFPYITDDHLRPQIDFHFPDYKFILGIDQGPTNFGAVLLGWDGQKAVACWEFFDDSKRTMRANLIYLLRSVPRWLGVLGARPENWILTVTDQDPPVWQILDEMKGEGKPWPHDIATRHQNRQRGVTTNWRRECQEWANNLSRRGRLLFSTVDMQTPPDSPETPGAMLLHDQLRLALNRPDDDDKESKPGSKKTWIIHDKWRGDHVCFHPDTQILTSKGWKHVEDVLPGDLVMTRSPEGNIEYRPNLATVGLDYDGELVSYRNDTAGGASFAVTPDHRLYVCRYRNHCHGLDHARPEFMPARVLVSDAAGPGESRSQMFGSPAWSRPSVPGSGFSSGTQYDSLPLAYFLGFYLAEGCRSTSGKCRTKYVNLDQKNPDVLIKIAESLGLPNRPYLTASGCYRLSIADPDLYSFVGHGRAKEKRIPRWFFDSASLAEHYQLFFGLMDGDGTWSQNKYDSISSGLVDDVQELLSRLGMLSARVQTSEKSTREMFGRTHVCQPSYRVRFRVSKSLTLSRRRAYTFNYTGKVYCVSVPPHNVVLTRYEGKTMWIGQCDAWFMALWCIRSGQIPEEESEAPIYDSMTEMRKAWEYQILRDEMRELGPSPNANRPRTERGLFQEVFGRPPEGRRSPSEILSGWAPLWYPDEG